MQVCELCIFFKTCQISKKMINNEILLRPIVIQAVRNPPLTVDLTELKQEVGKITFVTNTNVYH